MVPKKENEGHSRKWENKKEAPVSSLDTYREGLAGKEANSESIPNMSEQPRLVSVYFIWCCALVWFMVFGFYSPGDFRSPSEIFNSELLMGLGAWLES